LTTPRFAGLTSISCQATARLSTCRSACVASKRCPSGTLNRHAYTSRGDRSASRFSPSFAVALPSSQRSFAIVTGAAWCIARYSSTNSASVIVARPPPGPSRSSTLRSAFSASARVANPPT
jgi:hypothetical protein